MIKLEVANPVRKNAKMVSVKFNAKCAKMVNALILISLRRILLLMTHKMVDLVQHLAKGQNVKQYAKFVKMGNVEPQRSQEKTNLPVCKAMKIQLLIAILQDKMELSNKGYPEQRSMCRLF
jgi:hypothetical protein